MHFFEVYYCLYHMGWVHHHLPIFIKKDPYSYLYKYSPPAPPCVRLTVLLDSQCSILNVLLKKIQSSFLIIGTTLFANIRSSRPEVFLGKGVLKICRKFTGEHPCRSVISIKLLCSFIALQLYWNHTLAWVFSCKYAAYFQNTFY